MGRVDELAAPGRNALVSLAIGYDILTVPE
jgi:hypothetical protein